MIRRIRSPLQKLVMALAALSFILLGSMHHGPQGLAGAAAAASGYDAVDLAAYVLPDGTLPDLCNPSASDDGGDRADGPGCPACLLAKSVALASSLPLPGPAFGSVIDALPVRSDAIGEGHGSRAPPARGPPHSRTA
ncbi:hypothetical protein [Pannonibacter tanglangensis]|nr:hypothetical protein [Pannonibacter sp. XCT-34]